MTNQLHAQGSQQGLTLKVYRGDRSAFLAFDLDQHLAQDLAGFAVEGMRLVDHYAFRDQLQNATAAEPLVLQGPALPKGKPAWWERYYDQDDLSSVERTLFSR